VFLTIHRQMIRQKQIKQRSDYKFVTGESYCPLMNLFECCDSSGVEMFFLLNSFANVKNFLA
jgi:hypothetical protein